jgi:magnesium transporter
VRATRLLSDAFLQAHPEDAARVLERLTPRDQAKLFASSFPTAARVMEHMAPSTGASCLLAMTAENAAGVIRELSLDSRLAVLRSMEPAGRERIFQALGTTDSEPLRTLLRSADGTAGALMDPYLFTAADDITAGEVLRRARASRQPLLYYLYVLDREQKLVGVTTLRELMRARPSEALSSVMRREVARLPAAMRSDDIVKSPYWRDFHALPVVDEQGRFLGAIRHETLRHVEHEVAESSREGGAVDTLLALSELYWISLTGMIPGVAGGAESKLDAHEERERQRDGS